MNPALVRLALALAFTAPAVPLAAQLIPIRTVPVASGDQFLTLPTATLGMGSVTLAVDDSLADPWANPAQGVFIDEPALIGSPTFYGISQQGGTGRTFPIAGLFLGGGWFGGAGVALQQIENDSNNPPTIWVRSTAWWGETPRLSDASARNLYAQAFVGRRLGPSWSIGLGVSGAALDAVDGVDLLYVNAEDIDQSGTTGDVRLGLFRQGARDRLALLAVHNRVSMEHEVTYVNVTWNPTFGTPSVSRRVDENLDHTRTWGVQVAYDRDLRAPGWRIGTSFTGNRKSHPKIPNYEIQNIPRDPGTTMAYEGGIGLSRSRGPTLFGLDVVLQPIWSETWQEAERDTIAADSTTILKGGKTIENQFFFTNVVLRVGLSHQVGAAGIQGGLEVRSYDYKLEQENHLTRTSRDQDEAWMEWSPSLGATFRFSDVELRYSGRLTTGTGQPGVTFTSEALAVREATLSAGADFIVAPQAPLTLQEATVATHQLSVRIPIR